ncbi:MAG: short-chain dehydrogenase, partial [Burkholderiaceae bacterium]|jgi:hypothetical protein|nr:short-chain dehydrogenase [Burkholderiaceae bacterium]
MPFLMDAPEFARRAADAMIAGARYRTIPWQMGAATALLKVMPRWLFDRITKRRKQKPRVTAGN